MPPSISDPPAEPTIEPSIEPAIAAPRRQWPADYYASATPDPVLPRGVSYGCGALAVLVLLIVFAGGAYVSKEGLGKLTDLALGTTLGEMRSMITAEVTKEQKETLEREVASMRDGLRTNRIPVAHAQPFLRALDKSMKDDKVMPAEVEQLTSLARTASAKKRP